MNGARTGKASRQASARRRDWLAAVARNCTAAVAIIASMSVLGWLVQRPVLTIFDLAFPIPHPLNTLVLVIAAGAMFALPKAEREPMLHRIVQGCAVAISLIGFYSIALRIDNLQAGVEVMTQAATESRRVPLGSALLQLMLGAAIGGTASRHLEIRRLTHWIIFAMGCIAAVTLINQTLLMVRFNTMVTTGISLPLALTVLAISCNLLALRPPARFLNMIENDSPGAIVLRRLLPGAIALPILVGWIQALAHRSGWVDLNAGEGGLVVFTIVSCAAVLVWSSHKLDQMNTHRFRAEHRASTDRDWLAATLGNINECVVTTTHAGRIGFLNRAAEELFGVKSESVRGRPLSTLVQLVDEGSGEALSTPLGNAPATKDYSAYSPAVRLPNGHLKPVSISTTSILDGEGRHGGGVLVLRDASAQRSYERGLLKDNAELDRRVEERTRELEQTLRVLREQTVLLQTFAATTPELIYAKDRNGRLILINPAAARTLNLSQHDALGKTAIDIFGDNKYVREHLAHDQRVIDSGESMATEESLVQGRRVRTFLVTKSPLRDPEGKTFGLVGVAMDITERKRTEHQLEQLLMSEYRLREEAENLSRSKDELLATVSHELRSPMNALKGWSQLFADMPEPDPMLVMRGMLAIRRNVDHQHRLVSDLLDNSRITLGKMSIERKPVDLAEISAASIDMAQAAARSRNIALSFHVETPRMIVNGDAVRLQQVVNNLLSNGIKFTPEGGHVDVRLRRQGDNIELAVSDDGVGMEPDFLPQVFSRLGPAHGASRRDRGFGIGLTLVKHLVEMHEGSVQAASPGVGKGATFIVSLKAADSPALTLVPSAENRSLTGT